MRIRRLGALALAAPLAMGFTILGAPASNAAATVTISPADGAVVTSSTLVVKGSVGTDDQAKLTFNGLSYEGKGSVSRSFDAHEMRNGSYTAKIEKKWWVFDNKSSTFSLRTAPYSPRGVAAAVSGGKLKVTWNLGPEPDLTGYDVTVGGVGTKTSSTGSFCGGTVCSATFGIPSGASGRASVIVHARRSNGAGGTLSSSAASTAATLPGGGSSPLPGGGSVPNSGSYPGLNSNAPLLPLTENSPLSLPTVAPDGATPGFQYPTPPPEVATQNPVTAPDARQVAAIDTIQWGKSIALALILLAVAAHLGTWTRRVRVASGPMGPQGMAARMARAGSGRARVRMAKASIEHAEAAAKAAALTQAAKGEGDSAGKPAQASKSSKTPKATTTGTTTATVAAAAKGGTDASTAGTRRAGDKPVDSTRPATKGASRAKDTATGPRRSGRGGRRRAK